MKLKVAFLSRLNPPNVGHTLMHDGVANLLKSASKLAQCEVESIHFEQHHPLRYLYSEANPARWLDALPDWPPFKAKLTRPIKRIIEYPAISKKLWQNVVSDIKTIDVAIACGGPALIAGMSDSAQITLMMNHFHGALKANGARVLNLGLGSCYPLRNPPSTIDRKRDRECAAGYVANSSLTIVRDSVAQQLLHSVGATTELDLCPVFHAYDEVAQPSDGKPKIVINYMTSWPLSEPHQRMQAHPDIDAWTDAIRRLVEKRSNTFDFVFSCHNQNEVKLAQALAPGAMIAKPETLNDYREIAKGAVACIAGRIHCAIPLASLGVPGLAVGTDTRMLTCDEIGIKSAYVEDINAEYLDAEVDRIVANRQYTRDELQAKKEASRERYAQKIASNLLVARENRAHNG